MKRAFFRNREELTISKTDSFVGLDHLHNTGYDRCKYSCLWCCSIPTVFNYFLKAILLLFLANLGLHMQKQLKVEELKEMTKMRLEYTKSKIDKDDKIMKQIPSRKAYTVQVSAFIDVQLAPNYNIYFCLFIKNEKKSTSRLTLSDWKGPWKRFIFMLNTWNNSLLCNKSHHVVHIVSLSLLSNLKLCSWLGLDADT